MSILDSILGPASKYDDRLPYAYEARVTVPGVPGMTERYIADTLCGLLERLREENADPANVTIREVHTEGEMPILTKHCLTQDGQWLRRPESCRVFEARYTGHERAGRCCYRDRRREADGPFVDLEPPS
jgi:hypothetical protein